MPVHHAQRGFTLLEMMVTVGIVAILAAFAVPGMRTFIERNGVENNMNGFLGSINFARSEAIKRGMSVVMCRSANADTSATPTCSASGGAWATGWIIFTDFNGNGSFSAASGDVLLRAQGSLAKNGEISQMSPGKLIFRPTGIASSGASGVNFNALSGDNNLQRAICVTPAGRAQTLPKGSSAADCT